MPNTLQIPSPCSQPWAAMSPAGFDCRFCAACARNIVDFTQKTDAEILFHLQKNQGRVCGRFRPDQLNRPLIGPRAQRRIGLAAIAAGFATMLAAQQPMQGQKAPEIVLEAEQKPGMTLAEPVEMDVQDSLVTISGKVVDMETGEALIGCSIALDSTVYGAVTNLDGLFSLQIPASSLPPPPLTLTVHYTGYLPESIPLPTGGQAKNINLNVTELYPDPWLRTGGLVGIVLYNPDSHERPTFKERLHRFFHRNR